MKRSPAAAFWLSLLPGVGHVYVGQPTKGLVLIVSVASAIYLATEGAGAFIGIIIPFLWIFSMIDAHRSAVELNHLVDTGHRRRLARLECQRRAVRTRRLYRAARDVDQ